VYFGARGYPQIFHWLCANLLEVSRGSVQSSQSNPSGLTTVHSSKRPVFVHNLCTPLSVIRAINEISLLLSHQDQLCFRRRQTGSGPGRADSLVLGTRHASCRERGTWQPSTRHTQECSSRRRGRTQLPNSGTAPDLLCPISAQHQHDTMRNGAPSLLVG